MNKKLILIVFLVLDFYFLYATVGYFLQGFYSPTLHGDANTYFMGNYLLAISFGVLFILCTFIILYLTFKRKIRRG